MILNNYYKLLGLDALAVGQITTNLKPVNFVEGKKYYYYPYTRKSTMFIEFMNNVLSAYSSSAGGYILFGTGDTPASFDDYKLAGDVITGITAIINRTSSYSENQSSAKATYTITNNGAEEITIKEIGCFAMFYFSNGAASRNNAMIDRTVLDNPVTIPAGGIGQVEYTITFNYPTA